MSYSKVVIQKAKDIEAILVTGAFACSVFGLLAFAYLGYVGFVLGVACLWLGFQQVVGKKSGQLWYRIFAIAAIVVALVDISATYFSR